MLKKLLISSRPRFWLYLLGPYLIGVVSAISFVGQINYAHWDILLLFAIYFVGPANLLLYGVNDIFDYETDKLNQKKYGYEAYLPINLQKKMAISIFITNLPFFILTLFLSIKLSLILVIFLILAIFYSVPPIRFKARPFLDSISNILYIVPGIFGYYLAGGADLQWSVVIAASLWSMAMHAYSAIPDIEADQKVQLHTIATFLGKNATLLLCSGFYLGSSLLASISLHGWALVLVISYLWLMQRSFQTTSTTALLKIYSKFPVINIATGFIIFILVALNLS